MRYSYLSLPWLSKSDERTLWYTCPAGSLDRVSAVVAAEKKARACREQMNISLCYTNNNFPYGEMSIASSKQKTRYLKHDKWTVFKSWLIGISVCGDVICVTQSYDS